VNQLFSSQFPERLSNSSLLESTQSSGWVSYGLLIPLSVDQLSPLFKRRSACASLSLGRTGPPSLTPLGTVPRCLTTLAPATSCARFSSSSSLRHPAQSLEPNFLFTVPASTTGPSRFPQSRPCGVLWYARFPCFRRIRTIPDPTISLGRNSAPESVASRCGSRLTLSNNLTSWL